MTFRTCGYCAHCRVAGNLDYYCHVERGYTGTLKGPSQTCGRWAPKDMATRDKVVLAERRREDVDSMIREALNEDQLDLF